jgi:hypothetical protein
VARTLLRLLSWQRHYILRHAQTPPSFRPSHAGQETPEERPVVLPSFEQRTQPDPVVDSSLLVVAFFRPVRLLSILSTQAANAGHINGLHVRVLDVCRVLRLCSAGRR